MVELCGLIAGSHLGPWKLPASGGVVDLELELGCRSQLGRHHKLFFLLLFEPDLFHLQILLHDLPASQVTHTDICTGKDQSLAEGGGA